MAKASVRSRRRSGCPISIALEAIGDAWSLLIVRDLMFKDSRSYQQFLSAGEGIASNVLSDRLRKLEAAGLITKRQDPRDGRRFLYRLTERGFDLASLMVEMVLWSARHERTDAPAAMIEALETDRARVLRQLRQRWEAEAGG